MTPEGGGARFDQMHQFVFVKSTSASANLRKFIDSFVNLNSKLKEIIITALEFGFYYLERKLVTRLISINLN